MFHTNNYLHHVGKDECTGAADNFILLYNKWIEKVKRKADTVIKSFFLILRHI